MGEGFGTGSDFISFNNSPSPPPQSTPGPSKLPPLTLPERSTKKEKAKAKGKGKGKERAANSVDDEATSIARANGVQPKRTRSVNEDERAGKRRKDEGNGTGPSNLKEERKAAERGTPWVDEVEWDSCLDPAEMLNEEISAFYRYVSPTPTEYEVRLFVIELIVRAIHKIWPEAEVTPFGSWQTQLYLPTGDIDLVVKTTQLTASNKGRLLAELARAMRMAYITDVVAIISKARVPIIKFVTREGKLNVDISLNQTNGISAGKIINSYLDVLPGARQLIVVVKAFLSQRSMNEVYTGGLGSYAVICLVISFLQVHPKLRRSELEPERNLGTLLIEFLELYGRNFNYDEVGISIRRGGFYYSKRSRGWMRQGQTYLLSIEDPQDRDNDISGGSFGIRLVRATLSGAYELLQAKLFERAEQISARKSGRYQGDWNGDEMSILKAIMGVTKETIKHRREIQRLHEEGRLQRMLGIPPDVDPATHFPHYNRIAPRQSASTPSSKRRLSTDAPPSVPPSSKKKRRNTPPVNAILVDDDEVGDEFYTSESDDGEIFAPSINGKGNGNGTRVQQAKASQNFRDHLESVSHDEEEEEEEEDEADEEEEGEWHDAESGRNGESEDDSRYGLGRKRKGKDVREDGEVSSDDSVVELDSLPSATSKRDEREKVDRAKKRDFWKAKGEVVVVSDSEED